MTMFRYGNHEAEEIPAAGTTGFLCRSALGGYFFRVYKPDGEFSDYELRHDDLQVTISNEAMASFYQFDDAQVLDYASSVLGLRKIQPV